VCQIRQDPSDPTGCDYQTKANNYSCSAADACEGGSGGGTGYSSNGHVIAGHCSPGSYVEGNPASACTSYGYYKQCCSPGGVDPAVACSGGTCPGGSITSPGVTSCGAAIYPPSASNVSSNCSGSSASVTFSFTPGSGSSSTKIKIGVDSPTLSDLITVGSSPYTNSTFSPGHRIYYNYYACDSSGNCNVPDPNGYYYVDLPATCGGPGATNTPAPTSNPSFCSGTCGTSSFSGSCTTPGGQAGTWQWDGSAAQSKSNCDNVNAYCYTCVGSGPTPTTGVSCGSLGASCGCCSVGLCIGGVCRIPTVAPTLPPACRTYGQACGSGCCAGLVCNSGACLNPTPTTAPKVTVQGHFVDLNGNDLTLNLGQSVTINSIPPTFQSNSIFWSNLLPAGSYTVRASVPANYIVTSSTCVNCTTHSSYSSNNPVVVNLPSNGNYADIFFRYALNTCTTTFNGNVVVDPTSNNCTSLATLGGTLYSGSGQVTAFNGSSPAASTVSISSGAYSNLSYAPICGSASFITLSGVPYPVIGVCDGSSYTAQTSFTFPYTNTNSPTASRNVTFLVTSQGPWFQVDTGDVRFPDLSNKVPRGQKASASDKSLFASSTGNVNLWAGTFSLSQNWQVNQEYAYNSDFKNGLGSMSYTFYVSRARQRQLLKPNNISGASVDLSTLSSDIYQTDGNLTITASSGITGGKHIVLLVKGNATINSQISVPAGQNNLFVLATKGNLTFAPTVGTASLSSTASNVDGYYTAEGNIILSGGNTCPTSDLRLNVGGALIANSLHPFAASSGSGGKVVNNRNLCSTNLTQPAYYVSPRADFLFQLTDFYKIPYKTVQEVEP